VKVSRPVLRRVAIGLFLVIVANLAVLGALFKDLLHEGKHSSPTTSCSKPPAS